MRSTSAAGAVATTLLVIVAGSGCGGTRIAATDGRSHATVSSAPALRVVAAAPSTPGPCRPTGLAVTARTITAEHGMQVARFAAANAAQAACFVSGTPQLAPFGPLDGQSQGATSNLAVSQEPFPADVASDAPTATSDAHILLEPGQAATFLVGWYPASPVVCEQATGFDITAGDRDPGDLSQVIYAFGPMCDGLFYVSVYAPASSASGGG